MIKNLITILVFILIYYSLISHIFYTEEPLTEFPSLRARFGTIIYHSSDANGVYEGALKDPTAKEHIYCYYPKGAAQSKIILKRVDSGDCSNWFGELVINEGSWVSEREKFWWCAAQYKDETADCPE